jgi:integrase
MFREEIFNERKFKRLVPSAKSYVLTEKNVPTPDQLRTMLGYAPLCYKAMLWFLACTGARISEVLERKMSDLEIRPDGHARVALRASDTKARISRYIFLTKETVDLIQAFHVSLKETDNAISDWIFPGEKGGEF